MGIEAYHSKFWSNDLEREGKKLVRQAEEAQAKRRNDANNECEAVAVDVARYMINKQQDKIVSQLSHPNYARVFGQRKTGKTYRSVYWERRFKEEAKSNDQKRIRRNAHS